MKKIRFIINPKSGSGSKKDFPKVISEKMGKGSFEIDICETQHAGHATQLAKEAAEKNYACVVVAGGDGTVNEAARVLFKSATALGIIPAGSGNGLARHLGIPVNLEKALDVVCDGETQTIDSLSVNEHFCIGTIGVGFDAHIAHLFARSKKRGYSTYIKLVLAEFSSFKERRFVFRLDEKEFEKDCFLLTFANSSQFGNNAVIAPFADIRDGVIDVSIMRRFPAYNAPALIYRLMHNSIHQSKYFQNLSGKKILLRNNQELYGHIDGEPVIFKEDLNIDIHPLSIKMLVPKQLNR